MGKAPYNLILPESYVYEHKKGMVDSFNQSLEKVINENQHREDPYFISYHENDDAFKPFIIRGKWNVHSGLPNFWARQIVYYVDNKKGYKEWLWTINDDRKPFFNIEGVRLAKANGALSNSKKVSPT